MFTWLYNLLGAMLSFFSSITGSYAIALLMYALIFKIVFLPFNIKQQKNQIKMAKLTPKIEIIKAKYKGRTDQPTMQKQQQEIMELQQKEGYSPFSGCLPLLIQLPIIMLLYAVIQNPLSYIAKTTAAIDDYNDNYKSETYVVPDELADRYADIIGKDEKIDKSDIVLSIYKEFSSDEKKDEVTELAKGVEIKLINDLYRFVDSDDSTYKTREERIAHIESFGIDYESIPDFHLGKTNLADTPSIKNPSILVLIPILAALASWFSMWLSRKFNNTGLNNQQDAQAQASMKMMDLMMPAMTLFIAFGFSGMLGLYWIYQSLLGLLVSFIISRAMPLPKFTEEDLKELKRQQKEAEKAQREAMKARPKHRSLHYIDADDYDELPEAPKNNNNDKRGGGFGGDVPEIKD